VVIEDHDIAAYFGVNQGRGAEVKDGHQFSSVAATSSKRLPPSGPPVASKGDDCGPQCKQR
jgi:hypothetical protein